MFQFQFPAFRIKLELLAGHLHQALHVPQKPSVRVISVCNFFEIVGDHALPLLEWQCVQVLQIHFNFALQFLQFGSALLLAFGRGYRHQVAVLTRTRVEPLVAHFLVVDRQQGFGRLIPLLDRRIPVLLVILVFVASVALPILTH